MKRREKKFEKNKVESQRPLEQQLVYHKGIWSLRRR